MRPCGFLLLTVAQALATHNFLLKRTCLSFYFPSNPFTKGSGNLYINSIAALIIF